MRADRLALAVALALAPPAAWAGGAHAAPSSSEASSGPQQPSVRPDATAWTTRDALARQLEAEAAAVDRALAAVADKLAAARGVRQQRLRAAVRALRAPPGEDAMAVARRRAAARLLVARDAGEQALLADEEARLRRALARIASDARRLPALDLPRALGRPAPGAIARHFGTVVHERSRATLSRRGIDIDVDDHCPVLAPAAGTVRYAGPIRGLDQGVILDHGAYLTVIAKLAEVALPVGAPIAAGDRVGRAAHHRVYLEVRVKIGPGGLPIDPEPLLGPPGPPRRRPRASRPR
ncbi:MAG TPA: M23 family metallopeptidase [Kofleriaceae bacterium]|nr:M23 family metallopeptidase [Kofleriaceae bacterium]